MYKCARWLTTGLLAAGMLPSVSYAQEGARNFNVLNRLRVEYDDNIYQSENNEQDSFKIIEALELSYNLNLEQSFLSLRYMPSLVYWEDRDEDDSDLHHAFDAVINHAFNPRTSFTFKNTFRLAENPESIDRDSVARENNDYIYNTANAALSYLVAEATRLEVAGRVLTLRYDEDAVADINDYDLYVGGLTLRHSLQPSTAVLGELRYETLGYENELRDSDTMYVGGGVEHIFNPAFLGNIRAGLQSRDFDSAAQGDRDTPYVDGSITFLPTPATRITAGASYSQFEADVNPFASRERTRVFASLAHDITAKVSGYLTAAHTLSQYDGDEAVGDTAVADGDEDLNQFSARATYELNRNNLLEASWQVLDLGSDVRNDFTRNRLSLGWIVKI